MLLFSAHRHHIQKGQSDISTSITETVPTRIQVGEGEGLTQDQALKWPPEEPVGTKGPWVLRSSDQEKKINHLNKETLFAFHGDPASCVQHKRDCNNICYVKGNSTFIVGNRQLFEM